MQLFFINGPQVMTRSQADIIATLQYMIEDGTVSTLLRNRASMVDDISISTTITVLLLRLLIMSKLPMDGLDVIHSSSINKI